MIKMMLMMAIRVSSIRIFLAQDEGISISAFRKKTERIRFRQSVKGEAPSTLSR